MHTVKVTISENLHPELGSWDNWSQQENVDHPGCTMISELLVDNVRVNVASQSHH